MARAHGSYPWCRRFKSCSRYYQKYREVSKETGRIFFGFFIFLDVFFVFKYNKRNKYKKAVTKGNIPVCNSLFDRGVRKMNDKSRMILKMLAGGYILYIGISLLIGILQTEPNEKVLMIIVSIFFMAVGGTVLYLSVGALLKEYGVDIEFWKQKNKKSEENREIEQTDRRMSEGNSNINFQDLSESAKEEQDQQENLESQEKSVQEEEAVQEAESEETSQDEIEEDDLNEEPLDPEEDLLEETEEDGSEEEMDEEQEEDEDIVQIDEKEEKEEVTEEVTEEKVQEHQEESETSKEMFPRRQASISPMPQRK